MSPRNAPGTTEAPVEAARVPSRDRGRWRDHLGWVLSLFLIGLALKFVLIQKCDNSLPVLDQWDGEAADVYIPYFEHQLSIGDLFRAHNEHRIFWTRICDLGLLLLNGQWDGQLQIVANAAIHCAILAGFGWMMAGLLGKRMWPFIWLPLLLALAVPFAWENTLWGFQSQFYFLLLFALLTIRLLGTNEPQSSRWRLGVLAAFAGLFSTASGFLAVVAVLGMVIVEIIRNCADWKRHLPTLTICALVAILGLLLKADVPETHKLRAQGLRAFMAAAGAAFAWPNQDLPWLAAFNLLPLLLLGWLYVRRDAREATGVRGPAELVVLGLGLWVLLQGLASSYARGQNGEPPASRYMDTCSFLLIANCLSLILIFSRHRERLRIAPVWAAVFVIWIAVAGIGLWRVTNGTNKTLLSFWMQCQRARVQNTRAFMATDDDRYFTNETRFFIPYPYVPMLTFLLRTTDVRSILPACVRDPLKVTPCDTEHAGFVTNGCDLAAPDPATEIFWGSFLGGAQARASFESAAIKMSTLPYLEIPVAGDLGKPDLALALVDQTTGKTTPINPSQVSGRQWLNVYVRAPAHKFKIVARDDNPTGWFAFKAPREMGRWSYWAMNLIAGWRYILAIGIACLVWGIATLLVRRPTN